MLLIRDDTIIGFNIGDQIVEEYTLELSSKIHVIRGTSSRSALGIYITCGGRCRRCSSLCRSSLTRSSTLSRGTNVWSRTTGTSGEIDTAVFHYDDKGSDLALSNQVVHNQVSVSLVAPAGFIFPHPVLEIQHGVMFFVIFVIVCRRINVNTTNTFSGLGEIMTQIGRAHV